MEAIQKNTAALSAAVRAYREAMLADPYRPTWHFAVPDDNGYPGDPNGAFYADGRYHLMYLYRNTAKGAFHWGHISSSDLLHWRHHPDALEGDAGDEGCFSGGAFLDDDGTAYLTFWKFPSKGEHPKDNGGIGMAKAYPPYEHWERMEPVALEESEWGILDMERDREVLHLGCADPSNIWKSGGLYYMQTGNLCVLNKYGRNEDSVPAYRGDHTDLFRSRDLSHWEYVGRFYENPHTDADYPDDTEDDMCPEFLPLPDSAGGGKMTDRYLQLFIAHNRGAQYYTGKWDAEHERFLPETHGRFSWRDSACFAPESLIDGKNRQLAWFWFRDDPEKAFETYGWTGVYSFPRALWLENGILHMAPAEELEQLQSHEMRLPAFPLSGKKELSVPDGTSFRLRAEIRVGDAENVGFFVRADETERTEISYDRKNGGLVVNTENSGCTGWRIRECAPFALSDGETLSLDIMVDRSVVEVYANERQAIARRVYPTHPERAVRVIAFADGGEAQVCSLAAWKTEPTNPY